MNQIVSAASRAFPVTAVLAVVLRADQVLLVRRRNPPDAGLWGFPGGKIDFGEAIGQAAVRELLEETGVRAEATRVLTALDAYHRDECGTLLQHFVMLAVECRWLAGEPLAADDADEAAWFPLSALRQGELMLSEDVAKVVLLAQGKR